MRFKNTPSLSNYLTPKIDGIHKVLAESTERQNEKTRQKAGFSGVPEILKAFSGTLYGAAPDERYVSARPGFPGVWISLENSAYPN
ncbi:hypothetical protein [Pseudomonas sivasensis]|uniref:hypothetical protein n=1 Tax=Pseudomonas sivasensis TaxID=1880678 RepID=UPI0030D7F7E0